jgi:hypothetical protein
MSPALVREVLAAVQLHRQPMIRAVEVEDVAPDRMLAAELHAGKLPPSE